MGWLGNFFLISKEKTRMLRGWKKGGKEEIFTVLGSVADQFHFDMDPDLRIRFVK